MEEREAQEAERGGSALNRVFQQYAKKHGLTMFEKPRKEKKGKGQDKGKKGCSKGQGAGKGRRGW